MSTSVTSSYRRPRDHFEPTDLDPHEQRRLRGQLEQIDYTAFISNREVIPRSSASGPSMRSLGLPEAGGGLGHGAGALAGGGAAHDPDRPHHPPGRGASLQELRLAFDELTEAYEGLRRVVERGYLPYRHTE
jgi:hypothetical protein